MWVRCVEKRQRALTARGMPFIEVLLAYVILNGSGTVAYERAIYLGSLWCYGLACGLQYVLV